MKQIFMITKNQEFRPFHAPKKYLSILSSLIFNRFFPLLCTPVQTNSLFKMITEDAITNTSLTGIVNN